MSSEVRFVMWIELPLVSLQPRLQSNSDERGTRGLLPNDGVASTTGLRDVGTTVTAAATRVFNDWSLPRLLP